MPQVRQGDVLLIRETVRHPIGNPIAPSGDRVVLAEGEHSGHAHVVPAAAAHLLGGLGDTWLIVSRPTELRHEEHAAIQLVPGNYRVVIQREWAPSIGPSAAARARNVLD